AGKVRSLLCRTHKLMDAPTLTLESTQDAPGAFHAASGCALPKWYVAIKADPSRWAARMEKQRQRRAMAGIRDAERKAERERWAVLPSNHPRKIRKPKRTAVAVKRKARKDIENLPDSVVANRYLHMKVEDCPKALIEIKREHIKLSRKLGTRIKTI
ncbi:MAG: hypothetical protein ACOYMN_15200, partial [Roseimicrobium sp.]